MGACRLAGPGRPSLPVGTVHPPPLRVTHLASLIFLLLADSTDVGNIAALSESILVRLVVVAFVRTQVLRGFAWAKGARALSVERGFQ